MKKLLCIFLLFIVLFVSGQSIKWSNYYTLDLNKYLKIFSTDWDNGTGTFSPVIDTTYTNPSYTIYFNSSSSIHVLLDVYKIDSDYNIDSFNFLRRFVTRGNAQVHFKIKNITDNKMYVDSFKTATNRTDTLKKSVLDSLLISWDDTVIVQYIFKVSSSTDTIKVYNYEFLKFGGK